MRLSARVRVLAVVFVTFISTLSVAQTTRPVPQIERVLIISVDGLRPDLMLRAHAPRMRSLMEAGSFTFWAETTDLAVTLPSHVSMLTGVTPQRHGILWNSDAPPQGAPTEPSVPTLFEVARQSGHTTALVAGKTKFGALNRGNAIDWCFVPAGKISDEQVGELAAEVLRQHRPQVLVVHFPGPDSAGHARGWGSPEQIQQIEQVDAALGSVLTALDETGLRATTFILLTADHGGAGKNHGKADPRSRYIPWIAVGPGIRVNHDLTLHRELTVHTEDTFATACQVLGIPLADGLDGRPVTQILPPPPATSPSTRPGAEAVPVGMGG